MSSPFDSLSEFRNLFTAGLGRLLDAPDLGAYVLVLANALYDEGLSSQLHEPLQRRFEEHLGRVRRTLAGGQEPKDARDDCWCFSSWRPSAWMLWVPPNDACPDPGNCSSIFCVPFGPDG
jgi:hypothetical protein